MTVLTAIIAVYLAGGLVLGIAADILDGQDQPLSDRFGDVWFAVFCWPWILASIAHHDGFDDRP